MTNKKETQAEKNAREFKEGLQKMGDMVMPPRNWGKTSAKKTNKK